MAYTVIGNTVVEWDDNEPFIFTMSEKSGSKNDLKTITFEFDLSSLRVGFEDEFIFNLKHLLLERRHRISLVTVKTEFYNLELLFRKVVDQNLFETRRSVIDETFLLALNTIISELSSVCLDTLRRVFNSIPHSRLFANDLRAADFPVKSHKRGHHGKRIDNILSKALTRAACVEILSRCEEAYEDAKIDIGFFSFINLAFSVYVRPDSYRRIRLSDLVYDTDADACFLYIPPAKSGVHQPQKICFRINKHVGMLLFKQRQHVIETYGHLVDENDIGKLVLFPAKKLKPNKSGWVSTHANENFGELATGGRFGHAYFLKISDIVLNGENGLNATALRHTVGTQLAEQGCSGKTIQAVLKHASSDICAAYVDIAFHGLINQLSDAMQPAFESHLPVFQRFRSKDNVVAPRRAIFSEDLKTGRIELAGECGKQIRCQAAPFTCYECNKFIPCFDADHSINMDIAESEIDYYKHAGTPYRHLIEKARSIKVRIQLVMAACDRHQQAVAEGRGSYE